MYIYVYICIHTCTYIFTYVYMYIYTCMFIRLHACIVQNTRIRLYMRANMFDIYVHVFTQYVCEQQPYK